MSLINPNTFCKISPDSVSEATLVGEFIQNKLQKLFNTNVIITFNKITKTKA